MIFEDEHLLVVNKPPGWNTHAPAPFAGEGIYDWLHHREPRWANLAILHRLDKETSGVLVFGKTPLANKSLTQQFEQRQVAKRYLLVSDRPPPKDELVVRSHLAREGDRYVSLPAGGAGEPAETRFKLETRDSKLETWNVVAEPLTGRTHQIRVHAAASGFPILGDTLYEMGQPDRAIQSFEEAIKRAPDWMWAYNDRGELYLDRGDYDLAIKDFDQTVRTSTDMAMGWTNRCRAYLIVGRLDEALRDCNEALKLEPNFVNRMLKSGQVSAIEHRGLVHLKAGRWDLAIADLDDILPGLLERSDRVYYSLGAHEFDQRLLSFIQTLNSKRQSGHAPSELVALDHLLHEMRLFKSRAEISVMRQSAKIAVAAHKRAMHATRPGMKEYELEAEFLHEFRRFGAECSYPAIVAGGSNACVLHYRSNDAELKDGDLVLIDAGCEHEMYASDITRTFPVNGRFSEPQRELYELVLEANHVATTKAVAGNHWNDPHDAAVGVITRGLKDLGLLEGRVPQLVKSLAYKRYFMHRTGHWLGLDVHDVGDYKIDDQWRLLEAGMVMTIEPGIYVPADDKHVDKRWRGIGIRIEDDVHVTRDGPDILTRGLPATVAEIEQHMAGTA